MAGNGLYREVFYDFMEPGEEEPSGFECVARWGATPEEAIANVNKDVEVDEDDPGYHERLRLVRITVEEIPRPTANPGANAEKEEGSR